MKNCQEKNFSSQSVFHSLSSKGSSSRRVHTDVSCNLKAAPLPRKVLVLGKINQLGIDEGNGKTKIIFSRDDPPPTHHGKSKKHHILIPVKQEGSRTEFIKLPIYKVGKFPPSDDAGNVEIRKLTPSGNDINCEKVQKYATPKDQFGEKLIPCYRDDYKTEFIFQEPETNASDITQVSRTDSQPKKIFRSSLKPPDRFDKSTNTSEEETDVCPPKKPEIKPHEKQPEKEKKKFRSKCWKKRELKRIQREKELEKAKKEKEEKEAREREAKRLEKEEQEKSRDSDKLCIDKEESALLKEKEKMKKLEREIEKCKRERDKERREKERKKSGGTKDSSSTKGSRDENLKRKSSSAASSAFEIEPNPDSKVLPYLVTNKKKKKC